MAHIIEESVRANERRDKTRGKGAVFIARPKMVLSEFRTYELPADYPVLLLHGDNWRISPVPNPRLHFHNCVELGICREGSGEMVIGGRQLPFDGGTVTCIAPYVTHNTWSSPDTFSLWSYVYVDTGKLLHQAGGEMPDYAAYARLVSEGALLVPRQQDPELSRLLGCVISELAERQPGYRFSVRGLMMAIIARLIRLNAGEHRERETNLTPLMPALSYIRQHFTEEVYMEALAAMCHLSPTHFRRLFQQQIGTTPLDFLHQARIAASCTLLLTTGASVADIAAQVGYVSLSCFNRHFLRIMGAAPNKWRHAENGSLRHTTLTYTGWFQPETSEEILRRRSEEEKRAKRDG